MPEIYEKTKERDNAVNEERRNRNRARRQEKKEKKKIERKVQKRIIIENGIKEKKKNND